jgi:hypothetical protein
VIFAGYKAWIFLSEVFNCQIRHRKFGFTIRLLVEQQEKKQGNPKAIFHRRELYSLSMPCKVNGYFS